MNIVLTPEQIVAYHRRGFGVIEDLTTLEDIRRVRELLDGLYDRFDELPKELALDLGDRKTHSGVQQIPQINNATQFEPRLVETLTYQRAWLAAKQLLGDDARFRYDHSIYKPPHNARATPWHQDLGYAAKGKEDMASWNVAFWIPLQDTSVASGCMQFIPYSHLYNLRSHHRINHNPEAHTLETDGIDSAQAVACPIRAGAATIHAPKTLHYTGPNDTDHYRRVWILNFGCSLA